MPSCCGARPLPEDSVALAPYQELSGCVSGNMGQIEAPWVRRAGAEEGQRRGTVLVPASPCSVSLGDPQLTPSARPP